MVIKINEKIICVILAIVLFSVSIPTMQAHTTNASQKTNKDLPLSGYFIIGFMTLMNPEESITEFEIVSFVILKGNGENIRLNEGEMIKISEPIFAIIFSDFFIGYIGDYSIIG